MWSGGFSGATKYCRSWCRQGKVRTRLRAPLRSRRLRLAASAVVRVGAAGRPIPAGHANPGSSAAHGWADARSAPTGRVCSPVPFSPIASPPRKYETYITLWCAVRHGIREKNDKRHTSSQAAQLRKHRCVFGPEMPKLPAVGSALMRCGSKCRRHRQNLGTSTGGRSNPKPVSHALRAAKVQTPANAMPCARLLPACLAASERCYARRHVLLRLRHAQRVNGRAEIKSGSSVQRS